MPSRQRQNITRVVALKPEPARATFVIQRRTDNNDFEWTLLDAHDQVVCASPCFKTYEDCLKSLRAAQRLAATAEIINSIRPGQHRRLFF
jgi:hypothetical protein